MDTGDSQLLHNKSSGVKKHLGHQQVPIMTSKTRGAGGHQAPPSRRGKKGIPAGGWVNLAGHSRVPPPVYANLEKLKLIEKRPPALPVTPAAKPSPPPPPPLPKVRSKIPLYIGGVGIYCAVVYAAYIYLSGSNTDPVEIKSLAEQQDISHIYDKIAKTYDNEIKTSEFFMGMPLLRRAMAKRAQGDVLEASAGTGRNLKYYPMKKISSLTLVDSSSPMLEMARQIFQKQHPAYKNIKFVQQDAAAPVGKKFDTVIQSMGLCSHHSPVPLLRSLGDVCKDDGKIILLEHGRSHYKWLNNILDRYADKHAETWGCWWNRDIESILEQSGLQILDVKRYHFGTTYWIEAKPPLREEKTEG